MFQISRFHHDTAKRSRMIGIYHFDSDLAGRRRAAMRREGKTPTSK
jgi:hypothetical protein